MVDLHYRTRTEQLDFHLPDFEALEPESHIYGAQTTGQRKFTVRFNVTFENSFNFRNKNIGCEHFLQLF